MTAQATLSGANRINKSADDAQELGTLGCDTHETRDKVQHKLQVRVSRGLPSERLRAAPLCPPKDLCPHGFMVAETHTG